MPRLAFGATCHKAWKLLERVCSLNVTASDAFNPLVRHFAVRAFREEGFDEILFHHFAVEALFEAPQVTKPSIKKIIGNLLDNATAHRWNDLRDFRNDYVHGRRPSTSFYSQNLTELQILAAALITAMLHEVEKHPDLSRHQLLYALSQ
jgi:hypothetical protein